jgi:hypothetical protein
MANPKDKELSTNSEVKRSDDFQQGVEIKESVIELAKELLESTTEDAFSKMGYEKAEKKTGFYGTGKSYGSGTEQNKFGIRVAGKTKSSLEKQVMLGTKRMQSDIDFQYNGKMVSVEYKTTEAGFFRGVDTKSVPYSFVKSISVDGSKKAELKKAMKELFEEAAKKEVEYLSNTKIGVDDKLDKSTTSVVKENKQSMKKLTIKSIFSSDEDIYSPMNESKEGKENIKQVKAKNTIPLADASPYSDGKKKAEKGKFLLFDKDEKELQERAEKSELGKDEYLQFVKDEMKKKFGTSNFKELTPVEKKELFRHIDKIYISKEEKKERTAELNEDGGAPAVSAAPIAGVTASGPTGVGAGGYLTPNAFKSTSYGKKSKRPKITKEYKVIPNTEGYKNENFWTTVPQNQLDNLKHNHIIGAPGMEGIKVNSPQELNFASRGLAKNGPKKKVNESVESPKAKLDLTQKKLFTDSENKEKGINKRYLVTEKTSKEYLKERWAKLTNFKIYESIQENEELNTALNECGCEEQPLTAMKSFEAPKDYEVSPEGIDVNDIPADNLEETVTVQKPGSLFGLEYVFYKKDFLNEDKKYILDLNSKVFVPNPNIK